MNELPDDIYALTVKAIASGVKGVRLAHMLLGMLVTVALQLGMLCLLWHIVMKPNSDARPPETKRLWTQVGQLQGQLCWMQNALNSSGVALNRTGSGANCAKAWPSVDEDCPGADYDSISEVPSWDEARVCLLHRVDIYQDDKLLTKFLVSNDSIKSRVKPGCKKILARMGPALAAHGRGLLYPRMDELKVLADDGSCVWPATDSAGHPPLPKKRLVNGGWSIDGNLCTCDYTISAGRSMVDCSKENVNNKGRLGDIASHAQCIAPFKHIWEPPEPGPDIPNLVVNLLALMAIAMFVHEEVRRAASLCHTAAAVGGILPRFYARGSNLPMHGPPVVYRLHRHLLLRLVMLCAPLLQLVTALLVCCLQACCQLPKKHNPPVSR